MCDHSSAFSHHVAEESLPLNHQEMRLNRYRPTVRFAYEHVQWFNPPRNMLIMRGYVLCSLGSQTCFNMELGEKDECD